jgi:glycolate oxidase
MKKATDEATLLEYSRDAGPVSLSPRVVCWPGAEAEVVALLREALRDELPVTPRGGGTGIPTQSVGKGAVVLYEGISPTLSGEQVKCGPGLVKAELNRYLLLFDRRIPVDPSSFASCTVGGMVANNSSGARTLKYGSTVDYVSELRVVTPGGEPAPIRPIALESALSSDPRTRRLASLILENARYIEEERPKVTKNSCGYRLEKVVHDELFDLPKLFVGSEGTLGFTTEATLKTTRRPAWRALFIVETSLSELDRSAELFRVLGPSALELVDKSVFRRVGRWERVAAYSRSEDQYMLFCEFDGSGGGPEGIIEEVAGSEAGSLEPMVLTDPGDIQKAWDARNETLVVAQDIRDGPRVLVPGVEDLVVPPERLGDLVKLITGEFESRGLDYIVYGHAGDANLHARPLVEPQSPKGEGVMEDLMAACFEGVWRMRGSMTGEHGDGMLRAKFVERQYPRTCWIMREVKKLIDPKGVMNPGVKIA